MKNKRLKFIAVAFLLCALILQGFSMQVTYAAVQKIGLKGSADSVSPISSRFEIDSSGIALSKIITGVKVNDTDYEKVREKSDVTQGKKYWFNPDDGYYEFYIYVSKLNAGDDVKILTKDGYLQFTIKNPNSWFDIHENSSVKFVEKSAEQPEEPQKPGQQGKITLKVVKGLASDFYFEIDPKPQDNELKGVAVDGAAYTAGTSKYSPYNGGKVYYFTDAQLWLLEPRDGAIITLTYSDGKKHSFTYKKGASEITESDEVQSAKPLKLRLKGKFEGAMIGQRKYDGIAGASLSITQNKNSNVVLQAAEKEEPSEEDWKLFKELGLPLPEITLDIASGMKGIYSPYDSGVTLNGIPKTKGSYEVKAILKEDSNRITESNSLEFNVYDYDGTLKEYLDLEKYGKFFRKMQDGKYIWDMEPWVIQKFGGDNETVTVPKEVKAWYGSHTSGTYGELGTSTGNATQTLIVDKETNLTLVNMKVLSSVNIVVKNGGVLDLLDSSIHGKITVQDGGILRVNYNMQYSKFENGASINGQIELKDGAILENAKIYSNTNYLSDGKGVRHNVDPVVKVTGNATIKGRVFIRGDEAPTGTDPNTNEPYTGQPALGVENNAALNIEKNALLGTYGGGRMALTSIGAPAIRLNNGKIEGEGSLVAFAGTTRWAGEGRPAVSGKGSLAVEKMYIQGGDTYTKDKKGGDALDKDVTVRKVLNGKNPVGKMLKGDVLKYYDDSNRYYYWKDMLKEPHIPEFGDEEIEINNDAPNNPGQGNNGQADNQSNKPDNSASNNQGGVIPAVPLPENTQPEQSASPNNIAENSDANTANAVEITEDVTPEGKTKADGDTPSNDSVGKGRKAVKEIDDNSALAHVEDDKTPLGKNGLSEDKTNLPRTGGVPVQLYLIAGLSLMVLGFKVRKQK